MCSCCSEIIYHVRRTSERSPISPIFGHFGSFFSVPIGWLFRRFSKTPFEVLDTWLRSWNFVIIRFSFGLTTFLSLALEVLPNFQLSFLESRCSEKLGIIIESVHKLQHMVYSRHRRKRIQWNYIIWYCKLCADSGSPMHPTPPGCQLGGIGWIHSVNGPIYENRACERSYSATGGGGGGNVEFAKERSRNSEKFFKRLPEFPLSGHPWPLCAVRPV